MASYKTISEAWNVSIVWPTGNCFGIVEINLEDIGERFNALLHGGEDAEMDARTIAAFHLIAAAPRLLEACKLALPHATMPVGEALLDAISATLGLPVKS